MREGVPYRDKYMNNNVSDEPEETEPEEETWEERITLRVRMLCT